ncbi:hypothetical protein T439DRAFT_139196 [Meredithblackwellia eburnea MCA 4105]
MPEPLSGLDILTQAFDHHNTETSSHGKGEARVLTKTGRSVAACTRCRRGRKRCKNSGPTLPCQGCVASGTPEECVYTARGFGKKDREFRSSRTIKLISRKSFGDTADAKNEELVRHDLIPPTSVLIEVCKAFVSSYFQLGFFNEVQMIERVEACALSPFLLLAILAISAPFCPALLNSAQEGINAPKDSDSLSESYAKRARDMMGNEMQNPCLDNIQAFFLLGVYEWAHGSQLGWIQMGVAVKMAGLLRLHREATYSLGPESTSDQVTNAEIARRTFWLIQTHDNHLSSGSGRPTSFALYDIDVHLPSSEDDFSWGQLPLQRAVLSGSAAASDHPELCELPERSLMATMIQGDNLFGEVAKEACDIQLSGARSHPWETTSRFESLKQKLHQWEASLPVRQTWSVQNVRRYKTKSLDIGFISITSTIRLSNVILRRMYLPQIAVAAELSSGPPSQQTATTMEALSFWTTMASEMYENAFQLSQQIEELFKLRSVSEGCPPSVAFGIFVIGDLFLYLLKYPQLCPRLAEHALHCFNHALDTLDALPGWRMAKRWSEEILSKEILQRLP